MENFKVNGKVYKAKELDFNFLCDLADNGIQIEEIDKKILPTVRTYVAYCMGVDTETAGAEISKHIINGGNMEDIINVFSEKAENSDFFQALNKNEEVEKKTPKKSTAKKKEEEVIE